MAKFASPSCVRFISFGFLLATTCVWVWMVCSLHSVTTGSRDRANVPLIIIIIYYQVRTYVACEHLPDLNLNSADGVSSRYIILRKMKMYLVPEASSHG